MLELQSPEVICRLLGARIRALRLAHNLSQQELAEMGGASLSTVRRLEATGQGSLQLVVQVAQALHATQGLELLFVSPARSIAEAEAAVQMTRQRASKPRQALRSGGANG